MTRDQFGKLYDEGFALTCRFLVSRGVPCRSAEDIAQSAWLRAWERLPQLRDSSLTLAWVNSIARNIHLQDLRRETVKQQIDFDLRAPAFDHSAIIVRQALRLCPESDRVLLQQYYMQDVEVDNMAKEHGLSTVGVRIRVLRACRRLRKRLDS